MQPGTHPETDLQPERRDQVRDPSRDRLPEQIVVHLVVVVRDKVAVQRPARSQGRQPKAVFGSSSNSALDTMPF